MKLGFGLTAPILGLVCAANGAAALDITECGQVIPSRETGVLQADLDCPPTPAFCIHDPSIPCTSNADCPRFSCVSAAVIVGRRATLELNGHSLRGGGLATVGCARNCTVVGPGAIENGIGEGFPIAIYAVTRAWISDLVIEGGFAGIFGDATRVGRRIDVNDVAINDTFAYGIFGFHKVVAKNVTANGSGNFGIAGGRLIGDNITTNGNSRGIGVGRARITNLTALNNLHTGVGAVRLVLKDATATGNGTYDVVSQRRPRVTNVTCGKSSGNSGPWGFCQND